MIESTKTNALYGHISTTFSYLLVSAYMLSINTGEILQDKFIYMLEYQHPGFLGGGKSE